MGELFGRAHSTGLLEAKARMADETAQLVDEIAARVRRRLDALKAGTEEPCTASDGSSKKDSGAECSDSCFRCPNVDSCAMSAATLGAPAGACCVPCRAAAACALSAKPPASAKAVTMCDAFRCVMP